MKTKQSSDKISQAAKALDSAIEIRNIDGILACFANDCEIEILRQLLVGKEGVKKWVDWLYKHFRQIKFQPIFTVVEGNILFQEFIIRARLHTGIEIKSKQTEVLVFEGYKIKSLRLYFDRLDFAESISKDPISKLAVGRIMKKTLEGLTA